MVASTRLLRPEMHRLKGTVWLFLAQELLLVMCAVLPAIVMGRIEKRPFGTYGLPGRRAFGAAFWIGAVWGFVAARWIVVKNKPVKRRDCGFYRNREGLTEYL